MLDPSFPWVQHLVSHEILFRFFPNFILIHPLSSTRPALPGPGGPALTWMFPPASWMVSPHLSYPGSVHFTLARSFRHTDLILTLSLFRHFQWLPIILKTKPQILNVYFKTLHDLAFTFLSLSTFPSLQACFLVLALQRGRVLSCLVNFDQGIFFVQNALLPQSTLNSLNT